uniref:Uncharacterized protein n=1 Tax=Pyramimonas orientalis virus TaxID=455367 RepID=A0A7M3UNQ4_POV01|nr:hypothetical protein HWQ62_00194 [Pyramimonas orientalis virus]
MISLLSLLLILLIYITLEYIGNPKETYTDEIQSNFFENDDFDIVTESRVVNGDNMDDDVSPADEMDSLNNSTSKNTIDEIQRNQELIFNLFIIEVEKYNNAKKVLLYDSRNDCNLKRYKSWLTTIEQTISDNTSKLEKTECQDFKNNYCKNTDGYFSSDGSLYVGRVNEFKNAVNECFVVCQDEDLDSLREYKKQFYNTLFDILIRGTVLKKVTGDIFDKSNSNKYEYLINYNRNTTIAEVEMNLDAFSSTSEDHNNLVVELHSFIEILELEIRKFIAKQQIRMDEKDELISTYQARHYELVYNTVQPTNLIVEEEYM